MSLIQEKVLVINKIVYGEYSIYTANTYEYYARILKREGKFEEAAAIYDNIIKIYIDKYGEEHVETAITINNLANILKEQKKFKDALKIYEKV